MRFLVICAIVLATLASTTSVLGAPIASTSRSPGQDVQTPHLSRRTSGVADAVFARDPSDSDGLRLRARDPLHQYTYTRRGMMGPDKGKGGWTKPTNAASEGSQSQAGKKGRTLPDYMYKPYNQLTDREKRLRYPDEYSPNSGAHHYPDDE
ncbi:hypothetical protein EIP91_002621 [Steccherinum ochraceum]|uniref:Uncharacterized protein n=1 Tax=Steccherinum ochraceum TaxID=92696 RepID=A0A4R0RPG7_9APHY|nr:hypothetical protein EIP91_002621 [Steccherinum ochraceum]